MYLAGKYDVIVVGAGHAGCEAAFAAAQMGKKTLVLTISIDAVALMPCNPSVGGPAKAHLVREIDALGGMMAKIVDKAAIQIRRLNTGKGAAVQALRAQDDKKIYHKEMLSALTETKNIELRQALVEEIVVKDGQLQGVVTETGAFFCSGAVIVTTGTYLRGKIVIGETQFSSGPSGYRPAANLTKSLQKLGFSLQRFKTGTPPRIAKSSIDFSKMAIQRGDSEGRGFSHWQERIPQREELPCYLLYTNADTHRIIAENVSRAPLFSGSIEGRGPRYCPSVEDKVMRFSHRERHQVFLEPEGWDNPEIYVQGMSTSMPEDIQEKMIRSLEGMENARFIRPGYAIEYDALDPLQLKPSLESKIINGLFFAGQVNGTSGYEEASAQGLIAGINSVLHLDNKKPLILDRSQAYIGVLIDDLITLGTAEPYRMMTSRAEYRLILRHDNADIRLTEIGYKLGLISEGQYQQYLSKAERIKKAADQLLCLEITPKEQIITKFEMFGAGTLKGPISLEKLLRRPQLTYNHIRELNPSLPVLSEDEAREVEAQIKYAGYIQKQLRQIEQFHKNEKREIPEDFNFNRIKGLSGEALEKLQKVQPISLGQAARISGVTPADSVVLLIALEKLGRQSR